jgi:Gram-negative bacterial TonB protein C-terminal
MRRVLATSLLLSSLTLPAAAIASTPVDDATAPTPTRVSTGVVEPIILDSAVLSLPAGFNVGQIPTDAQVGLSLTVDTAGHPQNIRVVKSLNPFWDARVVDAVQRFHFRAGSVDNQPTPIDLNLTVNIAR